MSTVPSPPARPGRRVPSGGRPPPSRETSIIPQSLTRPSSPTQELHAGADSSLTTLDELLTELELEITASPHDSPVLRSNQLQGPFKSDVFVSDADRHARSTTLSNSSAAKSAITASGKAESSNSKARSQTEAPAIPLRKQRPKMSLLTTNLSLPATPAPQKSPISPGAQHWTHVRAQVLGDRHTPIGSTNASSTVPLKKKGLVSKAAGRLGFRQAVEHVLGYGPEMSDLGDQHSQPITAAEEEEARERRRFSRDIRACVDSCGKEGTRRTLDRLKRRAGPGVKLEPNSKRQSSLPLRSANASVPAYSSAHDLPAFAPLLTALHAFVPAARGKKPWALTLPWHAEVLTELGTAFVDSSADDGSQLMAMEIFGIVVRTWASARPEDEVNRWVWICKALEVDSKPLRSRGMQILAELVDPQASLLSPRPTCPLALQSIIYSFLALGFAARAHQELSGRVCSYIDAIQDGSLLPLSKRKVCDVFNHEPAGGDQEALVEREIVWIAVLKTIKCAPKELLAWLTGTQLQGLDRYEPPPILHAAPPLVMTIRRQAVALHLDGLLRLSNFALASTGAALRRLQVQVIPEIRHLGGLQEDVADLRALCTQVLLLLPVSVTQESTTNLLAPAFERAASDDPLTVLAEACEDKVWRGDAAASCSGLVSNLSDLADHQISTEAYEFVTQLMMRLLAHPARRIQALGSSQMTSFWTRLTKDSPVDFQPVDAFLTTLQTGFPQVLYKPFFTCAAASSQDIVQDQLVIILVVQRIMGIEQLWTFAPPDMLALVCMGDVDTTGTQTVKKDIRDTLGRSAIYVELIAALQSISGSKQPLAEGSLMRKFLVTLEHRFAVLLKAQQAICVLPDIRRSLLTQMFFIIRQMTLSTKPPLWLNAVIAWVEIELPTDGAAREKLDHQQRDALKQIWPGPLSTALTLSSGASILSQPSQSSDQHAQQSEHLSKREIIAEMDASDGVLRLVGAFHTSASTAAITRIAGVAWRTWKAGGLAQQSALISFLVLAALERSPRELLSLLQDDLRSAALRSSAQAKIAMLFSLRYQVLGGPWLLSCVKRSTLRFRPAEASFVPADLGSATWLATASEQDSDLLKFGRVLPLDVRQRLLALGWSEDVAAVGSSDWERVPVTQLPLQHLESGSGDASSAAVSPSRALLRQEFAPYKARPFTAKRRAVHPPEITRIIFDHTASAMVDPSPEIRSEWLALLGLVMRDDPGSIVRVICQDLSVEEGHSRRALQRIVDNVLVHPIIPPGAAYGVFNSLLGLLKANVRPSNPAAVWKYELHLGILASLAPHVCNLSMREIRRNKVESLLLPLEPLAPLAHGDESDGLLRARAAQYHLLQSLLAASPREAFAHKGPAIAAFPDHVFAQSELSAAEVTLARSWLLLVNQIFVSLNRNYDEKAELQGYLATVCGILTSIGKTDALMTAHCMRIFLLAATKFRRLFAANHIFAIILIPTFDVYAHKSTVWAVRDCIEYSMRGLLSVHMEIFVYELCSSLVPQVVSPSASTLAASRFFALLSCLARRNQTICGVTSGIKGLNDAHERDALVAMVNDRPELDITEIRSAADERYAHQLKALAAERYDASTFSLEDTIRLFITVIASDPSCQRAEHFLAALALIAPFFATVDSSSFGLLAEGVDALADIYVGPSLSKLDITRRKIDWGSSGRITPSAEGTVQWLRLQSSFVELYIAHVNTAQEWSLATFDKVLNTASNLLNCDPDRDPTLVQDLILAASTRTFEGDTVGSKRPGKLLSIVSPIFKRHMRSVDFAGLIDSVAGFFRHTRMRHDDKFTSLVIANFIGPCLEETATVWPATSSSAITPAIVRLLAAVLASGNTASLGLLNDYPGSLAILGKIILPLADTLSKASDSREMPIIGEISDTHRAEVAARAWVILVSYGLRACHAPGTRGAEYAIRSLREEAALRGFALQLVKLALINAQPAMTSVPGLWSTLGAMIKEMATGAKSTDGASAIRLNDWVLWTSANLLVHFKSPVMLELRIDFQLALASAQRSDLSEHPLSPTMEGRRLVSPDKTHSSPSPSAMSRLHQQQSFSSTRGSRLAPRLRDAEPVQVDRGAILQPVTSHTNYSGASTPTDDRQKNALHHSVHQVVLQDPRLSALTATGYHNARAAFGYEANDVKREAWTRAEATTWISQETRVLASEFEDVLQVGTDATAGKTSIKTS